MSTNTLDELQTRNAQLAELVRAQGENAKRLRSDAEALRERANAVLARLSQTDEVSA